MADLTDATLVHLAPRSGASGVGDHADDFAAAVAPHVGELVQLRHGAPRGDSLRDVLRFRRAVRAEVKQRRGKRVIVHAELSGGSIAGLWALVDLRGVTRTATLHDPPRPVWYPYLSRGVSRSRYVAHGVHRPVNRFTAWWERRLMRDLDLFALSGEGADSMRSLGIGRSHHAGHLLVAARPNIAPAHERPRAVGMFGHVYRGKGFDQIAMIRAALDDDIELRVAGRGTETLPAVAGVDILGAVEGPAEDAFFASIRALLLPYDRRFVYGQEAFPASSVLMRATAYATPSLSLPVGSLGSEAEAGATISVEGDAATLARAANDLVDDALQIERAVASLRELTATRSSASAIEPYLRVWSA